MELARQYAYRHTENKLRLASAFLVRCGLYVTMVSCTGLVASDKDFSLIAMELVSCFASILLEKNRL